jgi:hypothetical protein
MHVSSRRLQVVAGVLAMTSSLVVVATLVVSDVAGASRAPETSDELDAPRPVTMQKLRVWVEPVEDPSDAEPDFGSFEGY